MSDRRALPSRLPTRDHLRPKAAGGGPTIVCCETCNGNKASRSIHAWCAMLVSAGDYRGPIVAAFIDAVDKGALPYFPTDAELARFAAANPIQSPVDG